ncbi:septal ring lytic transglycosylase RlpA family protein [Holospora obtusa]|nr:septal ring lytic transglycosylase RlpA family protein [Holospora obtusa]
MLSDLEKLVRCVQKLKFVLTNLDEISEFQKWVLWLIEKLLWTREKIKWGIIAASSVFLVGCDSFQEKKKSSKSTCKAPYMIKGVWYYPQNHYQLKEEGIASYYGINDREHNGPDAMGGIYNMHKMTAAHKTLPLPCVVQVHNLQNNRRALVAVTDRGPFIEGRIIDVSVQAAKILGFFQAGTARVCIQTLEKESRILAQLSKKVSLKCTNLSDLLPVVNQICQNHHRNFLERPVPLYTKKAFDVRLQKPVCTKKSKILAQNVTHPKMLEKFYVSVVNLSFDQATWVKVQNSTFHWGNCTLKKLSNSHSKPFSTFLGPFLSHSQAQKVLKFFVKHHMSAAVLSALKGGGN